METGKQDSKADETASGNVNGPDELATEVIAFMRAGAQGLYDRVVCEVLRAAYLASLRVDEGRHPRFTIHLSRRPHSTEESDTLVGFAGERLTDDALKSLAFSVPGRPFALHLVQGVGGDGVLVQGVLRVESMVELPRRQGLFIDVISPGHLLVCNSMGYGWGVRLHEGVVRKTEDVATNGALNRACRRACERLLPTPHDEEQVGNLHRCLTKLIVSCIAKMVSQGHGGALGIVPGPVVATEGLQLGPLTNGPHLGKVALTLSKETGSSAFRVALDEALDAARVTAALTQVDGLVVMDDDFSLQAYGSKIHFDSVPKCRWVSAFVTSQDTAYLTLPWPEYPVKARGTRHQSAAFLAASVPDAVVVVVSQDGAVRVFENSPDGRPFVHECIGGMVGHTPIP